MIENVEVTVLFLLSTHQPYSETYVARCVCII